MNTVKLPTNPSESFKKRNPSYYGRDLGALQTQISKPTSAPPLDGRVSKLKRRSDGVEVRISLVSGLRKLYDSDNLVAANKPLRDAIATSLGIDDNDPRVEWQYGQFHKHGEEGVIVKIELV